MKPVFHTCRTGSIRLSIALLTMSLFAAAANAQSVLAADAAAPEPRNPLALAAGGVGVRQCLPALTALSAFGVRDARKSDVLLDWEHRKPNGAAVFSLLGIERDKDNAAMSIVAVPEADGSCSASAERIEVQPRTCKEVAQKELRGMNATQLLPQMTVYSSPQQPGSTVSLIDTSRQCLVIRRYVKYSGIWTSTGAADTGK